MKMTNTPYYLRIMFQIISLPSDTLIRDGILHSSDIGRPKDKSLPFDERCDTVVQGRKDGGVALLCAFEQLEGNQLGASGFVVVEIVYGHIVCINESVCVRRVNMNGYFL